MRAASFVFAESRNRPSRGSSSLTEGEHSHNGRALKTGHPENGFKSKVCWVDTAFHGPSIVLTEASGVAQTRSPAVFSSFALRVRVGFKDFGVSGHYLLPHLRTH